MHIEKHKNYKFLNSNLLLFSFLCLFCVIYLGFILDYWYFLFLIIVPFTFRKVRPSKWQILFYCLITITFGLLIGLAYNFSLFNFINDKIESAGGNVIKNSIIQFLDQNYDKEVSSFIKLILLNIKTEDTWIFYNQTINLGIVWLIGISGFHVSLLTRVIKRLFKKQPTIGKYVSIILVALYSFILGFSYASIRVLLKLSFGSVFKKHSIERYEGLGFIGLIIALFNPSCFQSYSFLLSFMVCIGTYFVLSLELNNKIITSLLINIISFVITIPFVIEMNHKIALLTFVNAFIFTYLSSFLFLYMLLFAWMPFMAIIHHGLMIATYAVIGNISFSNIFINSNSWPIWGYCLYYLLITVSGKALYLIVYNNKI